jgi:hypothetical protein
MEGHTLAEFLPEYKNLIYTYDMGDYWQHQIQLVRVIDEHNEESPYLVEAIGQSPPENVGGFVDFHSVMLNPDSPEYSDMRIWAGYWSLELSAWESNPKVIMI